MQIEQLVWTARDGWSHGGEKAALASAQVLLLFGASAPLRDAKILAELADRFPGAVLFGCSTSGEIAGPTVRDDTLVATAIRFERSSVRVAAVDLAAAEESRSAGLRLATRFSSEGLRHLFVLSEGVRVNGSELVAGLAAGTAPGVAITGGLSGDGARFHETFVLVDGVAQGGKIAALGLYGERLQVGYGSMGGWDPFGPERVVTRSEGNVLHELDGQSALELYKRYLGPHAAELPASGLLFPLSLRSPAAEGPGVVRTILGVDEARGSMTFAGDLPVGSLVRLMRANFERLIDGATVAARTSLPPLAGSAPELAILISCVGRKLVLGQRTEEEVEAAQELLGGATPLAGFYSYGEISPFTPSARCELHNQTMTITTLSER